MYPSNTKQHQGFAILEALIAALILSVGLLGMAALQASALRNNQSSLERTQAVVLSYSMLDTMRANLTVARTGGYNLPNTCAAPAVGATLASNDLNTWITNIQTALSDPAACGAINCVAPVPPAVNSLCTITITWNDSRGGLNQVVNAADAAKAVVTMGRL